jgi:circadian clock protein KaiC
MDDKQSEGSAEKGRVLTGVSGLDDVLLGGLTPNRLYLVEGAPGTGKTTLALQFLLEGERRGEAGLYVTLSESEEELREVATSHGWSLEGVSLFELVPEGGIDPEQEQSVLHPSEVELGETTRRILAEVERAQPRRIVLDSLSELRLLAQNALRYRRQILGLKHLFAGRNCTVLLLDDRTAEWSDLQLHTLVHGVITLEQIAVDFGAERRRLRVVKMRGTKFRGGYHDFVIDTGGLSVFPRLVAGEHHRKFSDDAVSTAVAGLDALLGGGLSPGTSVLIMGPSGVGKTTTAVCCMLAALERGERAVFYLFEEGSATFFTRTANLGMNLRPHVEAGLLTVHQVDPAERSPGEFAAMVRRSVEEERARIVVIDSLNGYFQAMPDERFLVLQIHELLSYLGQEGVITLVILAQHGLLQGIGSEVDVSYLSDAIMLLRYFEIAGEVRKAITVVKTRIGDHERTIRELHLGRDGLRIGDVLREFQGLLTGTLAYHGNLGSLLSAEPAPRD